MYVGSPWTMENDEGKPRDGDSEAEKSNLMKQDRDKTALGTKGESLYSAHMSLGLCLFELARERKGAG
jgi:hypothetical protein